MLNGSYRVFLGGCWVVLEVLQCHHSLETGLNEQECPGARDLPFTHHGKIYLHSAKLIISEDLLSKMSAYLQFILLF